MIDDERSILQGLQVVLSESGAEVLVAQNRDEALALADVWTRPPDIVLSDLLLRAAATTDSTCWPHCSATRAASGRRLPGCWSPEKPSKTA